jgi:hypothetical protein
MCASPCSSSSGIPKAGHSQAKLTGPAGGPESRTWALTQNSNPVVNAQIAVTATATSPVRASTSGSADATRGNSASANPTAHLAVFREAGMRALEEPMA